MYDYEIEENKKKHDFYQKAILQHKSGVISYHTQDKVNTKRGRKESINPRQWYVQDSTFYPTTLK